MEKTQTPRILTQNEITRGNFLIATNVTCSYCDQPVRVSENPEYLSCTQHHQLALSMYWYPGYPAVPIETPRYKEMHFFLSPLARNRPLFDSPQPKYIATEKGCPLCDLYITPLDANIEGQRDASLLNTPLFCPDCSLTFRIKVIPRPASEVLQLRFQLDARHLPPTAQNITDRIVSDPVRDTADVENQRVNPPPNQPPNPSQTHASETETQTQTDDPPNRHKDVEAQIVAFLTDAPQNTAETREMIDACDCTPESFNQARKRLLKHGRIRKIKRGVYQLINP